MSIIKTFLWLLTIWMHTFFSYCMWRGKRSGCNHSSFLHLSFHTWYEVIVCYQKGHCHLSWSVSVLQTRKQMEDFRCHRTWRAKGFTFMSQKSYQTLKSLFYRLVCKLPKTITFFKKWSLDSNLVRKFYL